MIAVLFCLLIIVDGYLLSVECTWAASGICWLWSLRLLQTHREVIVDNVHMIVPGKVIIAALFLPHFCIGKLCDA